MKKTLKTILFILLLLVLLVVLLVFFCDRKISLVSERYIYDDLSQVPDSQVVLVLGTSSKSSGGRDNLFYTYRMEAAGDLYRAGKVKAFILSGDNRTLYYNEPETMRKSLLEMGVPDEMIYLDYAGLRTLDSVLRAGKIFGQSTFVVVSQRFHNERAVYIARHNGLEAYGYNANDVPAGYGIRTFVRERFARVKVFLDILMKKEPRHLGEPVEIRETMAQPIE